jgi:hypothetical protein
MARRAEGCGCCGFPGGVVGEMAEMREVRRVLKKGQESAGWRNGERVRETDKCFESSRAIFVKSEDKRHVPMHFVKDLREVDSIQVDNETRNRV